MDDGDKKCRKCGVELTEQNWYKTRQRARDYLCKSCAISQAKLWRMKHPARYAELQQTSHNRLRKLVLDAYGHTCACCGETRAEFLAVDHINGRGKETGPHRPNKLYRALRDAGYPREEFRLLCHNCNCALGFYGYCPHEEEQRMTALEAKAHVHTP